MFANNMLVNMNLGFPDVCLTPMGPVITPVPYPNISTTDMALPTVPNVLIEGTPGQNMLSMGPTIPLEGAFTVLVNAMPITRLTTENIQNMTNCPGTTITPGQFTMLVLAA